MQRSIFFVPVKQTKGLLYLETGLTLGIVSNVVPSEHLSIHETKHDQVPVQVLTQDGRCRIFTSDRSKVCVFL